MSDAPGSAWSQFAASIDAAAGAAAASAPLVLSPPLGGGSSSGKSGSSVVGSGARSVVGSGGGLVTVRKVAVGARLRSEVGAPCCARISTGHKVCLEEIGLDGACPKAPLRHTLEKIPEGWKEAIDREDGGDFLYVIPTTGSVKWAHISPVLCSSAISDVERVEFKGKLLSVSD